MKIGCVYIGNILKCTEDSQKTKSNLCILGGKRVISNSSDAIKTKHELYKEGAILIQTKNGGYIDLEQLGILEMFGFYTTTKSSCVQTNHKTMLPFPTEKGVLYVEYGSLVPYREKGHCQTQTITISKLKKLKQIRNN